MAGLKIRVVNHGDWARLLDLRNDPDTRAASFSEEVVTVQEHMKWFGKALIDPEMRLLVAEDASSGEAVGTVRLDLKKKSGEVEVSISVDRRARGKGYAAEMLSRLIGHAPAGWPVKRFVARIKADNFASLRAFARAGFTFANVDEDVVTMKVQVIPEANDAKGSAEI